MVVVESKKKSQFWSTVELNWELYQHCKDITAAQKAISYAKKQWQHRNTEFRIK
jgi:hypothetical protein